MTTILLELFGKLCAHLGIHSALYYYLYIVHIAVQVTTHRTKDDRMENNIKEIRIHGTARLPQV